MLPKWYKDWVSRVSDIVSYKFPFDWNSKERYLQWLSKNNIDETEYLKEAQEVWTFVHSQVEKYTNLEPLDISDRLFSLHEKEIQAWKDTVKYLILNWEKPDWSAKEVKGNLITEQYIIDSKNRYQWSVDLILKNEKEKIVFLYDYKTYWIAKKKFWLPNLYKKPYDKLKKVELQLSLYAKYFEDLWYKIWGIFTVYLHETGCYIYRLEKINNSELESLILDFENQNKLPENMSLKINKETMEVTINTNLKGQAYTNAQITLQEKDYEWLTEEEKIDKAIELQKYLLKQY